MGKKALVSGQLGMQISREEFDKIADDRKPADAHFLGAIRGGGVKGRYWYTCCSGSYWKVPIRGK